MFQEGRDKRFLMEKLVHKSTRDGDIDAYDVASESTQQTGLHPTASNFF